MNRQELLELIGIDEPAGMRILQASKITAKDIIHSDFNQQELAIRLCDYSNFEQCLNHVINYPGNEQFSFIYKYFDRDFTYNCLQMEACYSCYKHADQLEEIKQPIQKGQKSKLITYSLGKIYSVSGILIEARDEVLNRIKVHLPGDEIIPYSQEYKPPLIAQSITIEYPTIDIDKCTSICMCSTYKRDIEDCPKCIGKIVMITFIGTPVIDVGPITNEEEVQIINNLVSELESHKQENLNRLRELNYALSQFRFKVQMVQQMKDAFKEFNQAAILSEMYNRRVIQFYKGAEVEKSICRFSNCVECSRRVLQQAVGISENLLRKLYFSDKMTQKERDTAIRILEPNTEYKIDDFDVLSKDTMQYQELCLQAQLYLKGGDNIHFIKKFLNKCIELKLDEIIIAILKTLIKSPMDSLSQLLTEIKIENICLKGNVISQLFLISNIEIQECLQELIINVCKNDEYLGLNILLNGLEYSNDQKFYQTFDEVQIKNAGDVVVEYLVNFIKENYQQMEQQKLLKCFQMILRCWNILTTDQLKWYIELDKLYNNLGQSSPRINEVFIKQQIDIQLIILEYVDQ